MIPAPYLTVNSSTSITATTPAITTGSPFTYYVTVTTAPGGNSGSTGPVFNYSPLTPVVASVSPTSGGPGTVLTITGIGFVSGATTVSLVPQSGGGGDVDRHRRHGVLLHDADRHGSARGKRQSALLRGGHDHDAADRAAPPAAAASGGTPVGYSY